MKRNPEQPQNVNRAFEILALEHLFIRRRGGVSIGSCAGIQNTVRTFDLTWPRSDM
jgi:hypothetical protein